MTTNYLRYEGIKATEKLAGSSNAKLVMIGGQDGLPLVFNTAAAAPAGPQPAAKSGAADQPDAPLPRDWPITADGVQQFMHRMDTLTDKVFVPAK